MPRKPSKPAPRKPARPKPARAKPAQAKPQAAAAASPAQSEITSFIAQHFPATAPRISIEPVRGGSFKVFADVRGIGQGHVTADRELFAQLSPAEAGMWNVKVTDYKWIPIDGTQTRVNKNKVHGTFWLKGRPNVPLTWAIAIALYEIGYMRTAYFDDELKTVFPVEKLEQFVANFA